MTVEGQRTTDRTGIERVLVFGEERRLRAAVRVAACWGADVEIEDDPARVVGCVADLRPDVVLFDHDHAGPASIPIARRMIAAHQATTLIMLADPSPPTDIYALLIEPWFSHLLGVESPWFMDELAATLGKLDGDDIFGLSCYLPWGTRVITHRIEHSDHKRDVFDRIEAFMARIGVGGRIVTRLHSIADEMLMNAIYDAPVDSGGATRYAALPRSQPVALEAREQPVLRFASDGRTFGISITDPFGGLTIDTIKRYVAKGIRRGADQIDRKEGGAGLGLYLLFDHLHSMCLNLDPGRRTELLGLMDIRGSFRTVRYSPKSLNAFEARPRAPRPLP